MKMQGSVPFRGWLAGHVLPLVIAAALILVAVAAPAAAAPPRGGAFSPQTVQSKRMIAAFKSWATRWNVTNTSIAIMSGTTLLGTASVGTYKPGKIKPVASESKTITGICIAKLVEAGKFKFGSKLRTLLKKYLRVHPPVDSRVGDITVGELLDHSSGIHYDPSQGSDGAAIEQLPLNKTNLPKQVTITFSQALGAAPGASYFYNNMNYAVLGLIVETVTGQPYETYCGNTVLKPVGVTDAELNPTWRVMSSWGGWKISPADYVRFLEYFLPSQKLLSIPPAKWPKSNLGGGAFYSLGTLMRKNGTGHNYWHEGSWLWLGTPQSSFGAYFTVIQENVRYMADFSPTLSDAAVSDLDSSMFAAAVGETVGTVEGPAQHRTDQLPH